MKVIKTLAVLAFASAVLFSGCQNDFTGTSLDTKAVAASVRGGKTDQDSVVVASISPVAASLENTTNQTFSITFDTHNTGATSYESIVDVASLEAAVVVRNLKNGAANDVYTQDTEIPESLLYVDGDTAYFNIDCTNASGLIEVFVNSTVLTFNDKTKKLDQDEDHVQGEVNDDDFYENLEVTTYGTKADPTVVTGGVVRDPRVDMDRFGGLGFSVSATATTINTLSFTYNRAHGLADALTDTTDYKALFDSCFRIEKYNPAKNSWTSLEYVSTYIPTTGDYTATFAALAEGDVIRYRKINLAKLQTTVAYSGFIQKFERDAKIIEEIGPEQVQEKTGTEAKLLTEDQQNDAFLDVSSVFDNYGYNGKIIIDVDNTDLGNKGIDSATVTPDSIRLYLDNKTTITPITYTDYYEEMDEDPVYSAPEVSGATTTMSADVRIQDFISASFTYNPNSTVVDKIFLNLDPKTQRLTDQETYEVVSQDISSVWMDPDAGGPLTAKSYIRVITVRNHFIADFDASLIVSSALKGLGDDATVTVDRIPVRSFGDPGNNASVIPALYGTRTLTATFKL